MGALTKLDAVNRMLRAAGEYPVSTLEGGGVNDTLLAVQTLDEQVIFACSEKMSWNMVYETLNPQTDGRIVIGDNTIAVDAVDPSIRVQTRGRTPTYLFNVAQNTDQWTAALEVERQVLLGFEELPTASQFEVVDTATRFYQMSTVGDTSQDGLLAQQMLLSRAMAKAADVRQRDSNFMYGAASNPRNVRGFSGSNINSARRGLY